MTAAHGSVSDAVIKLEEWFGGIKGLSKVYDFFVGRWNNWPPLIAKSCKMSKHRFNLWLVAHRKLLTRDRLGYLDDRSCVLCNFAVESVNHLFFDCPISQAIWNSIRSWLGMRKLMRSLSAVLAAFRSVYRGTSALNKMRCVALGATVYQIWNIRNRTIFEHEQLDMDRTIMKIKIHVLRSVPNADNVI
ncbi:uncharacterized protein [Primulina eburnea]|uniref:uncharacterized protein n=1 Tax=Primulina eburnea TaxID=1245227 RepID=UPI003C6C265F